MLAEELMGFPVHVPDSFHSRQPAGHDTPNQSQPMLGRFFGCQCHERNPRAKRGGESNAAAGLGKGEQEPGSGALGQG